MCIALQYYARPEYQKHFKSSSIDSGLSMGKDDEEAEDEPKYKVFDALNRVRPPINILDLSGKK